MLCLIVGRNLQCQDNHDCVYAFLGLAAARFTKAPHLAKRIVPDYNISAQQLFL
jgi:hypothetical protein